MIFSAFFFFNSVFSCVKSASRSGLGVAPATKPAPSSSFSCRIPPTLAGGPVVDYLSDEEGSDDGETADPGEVAEREVAGVEITFDSLVGRDVESVPVEQQQNDRIPGTSPPKQTVLESTSDASTQDSPSVPCDSIAASETPSATVAPDCSDVASHASNDYVKNRGDRQESDDAAAPRSEEKEQTPNDTDNTVENETMYSTSSTSPSTAPQEPNDQEPNQEPAHAADSPSAHRR